MKINLPKLEGSAQIGRWFSMLGLVIAAGGLNSCKLPDAERYAQADWSVRTSVTKEDYPVEVSVEQIEDVPMPSEEEIAQGLPNYQGSANKPNPWAVGNAPIQKTTGALPLNDSPDLPIVTGGSGEPPMPSIEPGQPGGRSQRVQDNLLASGPEPTLPDPNNPAQPTPVVEVRPARVNSTPENLALMAAHSARPYLSPRGNSATVSPGFASQPNAQPGQAAQTAQTAPPTQTQLTNPPGQPDPSLPSDNPQKP